MHNGSYKLRLIKKWEEHAISAYSSELTFKGSATFTHNRAKRGGAIYYYAVESFISFVTNNSHPHNMTLQEPSCAIAIDNKNFQANRDTTALLETVLSLEEASALMSECTK